MMWCIFATNSFFDTPKCNSVTFRGIFHFEVIRETAEDIGALEAQMWVYEHLAYTGTQLRVAGPTVGRYVEN